MSSGAYYLIDGKVKFYFNQSQQFLQVGEETLPLQRREAQTLQFILDNQQDSIKADAIAVYLWGEGPVNDDYTNKKSQAITHVSRIRKRLEQLGLDNRWLETQGGQGYKVSCSAEFIDNEEQRIEALRHEAERQWRQKWFKIIKHSGLSALLTAAVFVAIYVVVTKPPITLSNVVQLQKLTGVSIAPRYSPSADAIAFSYQTNNDNAKIYLKVDSDINYRALTSGHFDQSPAFSPSGRQLAYQRRTVQGECEIRLLRLDQDHNKVGSETKVAQCSTSGYLSSIEWLTEDRLLFTDKMPQTGLSGIYQVDLGNGDQSVYLAIDDPQYYGVGYYYMIYDPNSAALYVLDGEEWSKTNIYRFSQDKVKTKITTIVDSLRSIAILGDSLLFKDLDNQLKTLSLADPQVVNRVYSDPLNPIDSPVVNSSQTKVAFVAGEYYQSRIRTLSLSTGIDAEIISSTFKLRLPKASKDEVLVTSRESGINQIYAYQNNVRQQLTDFNINQKIVNFASSTDKKWLAINFTDGTTLYKRNQRGLTEVKRFELLSYPDFSANGKRLLLSDLVGDDGPTVIEYDLASYATSKEIEPTHIRLKKSKFAVYHQLGIIYVPADKPGVYLLTRNSDEVISEDVSPTTPEGFGLSDTHLYVAGREGKMVNVDLSSGQLTVMPDHLYGVFSIYQDQLFYIAEALGHTDIVVGNIVR